VIEIPSHLNLRVDQAKVTEYLLSHSNGRGKAAFFLGFGFRVEAWEVVAEALKQHARCNPVATTVDSRYGTRYSINGALPTPSGKRPKVRSVWILEIGSRELRLVTAHPIQEA
jgi:hypothetical protein